MANGAANSVTQDQRLSEFGLQEIQLMASSGERSAIGSGVEDEDGGMGFVALWLLWKVEAGSVTRKDARPGVETLRCALLADHLGAAGRDGTCEGGSSV